MTDNNELGEYIKKFRGSHSIREAATIAGISHSYWSDLERGYSRASGKPVKPTMEILSKVAYALSETNNEKHGKDDFIIDFVDFLGNSSEDIQIYGNDEYSIIKKNSDLEIETFDYPINDLRYHLTEDFLNKKFYKGVPLSSTELKRLNSIIELYLESTFMMPLDAFDKLINLVGKRSLDELQKVYSILKLAIINVEQTTSFDDFVSSALLKELDIKSIDLSHAFQIANDLFNVKQSN